MFAACCLTAANSTWPFVWWQTFVTAKSAISASTSICRPLPGLLQRCRNPINDRGGDQRNDFTGVWWLLSREDRAKDGSVRIDPILGPDARGILTYANGRFAAQFIMSAWKCGGSSRSMAITSLSSSRRLRRRASRLHGRSPGRESRSLSLPSTWRSAALDAPESIDIPRVALVHVRPSHDWYPSNDCYTAHDS